MSERPTPETDAAERMAYGQEYMVSTEVARKLERERDEARKELEEYRSIAENIGAVKAVSEKEKAIRERDEAREKLAKITQAAEAVIDRWEQPTWKDTEPTGAVIYRLRDALGREAE